MTLLILLLTFVATDAWATTRYADNSLASDCTSGNYSIASRNCTGSDGNAYNDFASAVSATQAGDTLYIRAHTGTAWTQQLDFQLGNKSGTSTNWITVAGYPGETVIIQWTSPAQSSYGPIKARGNRGYFIFENLVLDGVNDTVETGWALRDGNHHFIIRNMTIKNQYKSGLYIEASDITIEDSIFKDARSDCAAGHRYYGWYIHDGSRIIVRRNQVTNMPGGGAQVYNGPLTDVTIEDNVMSGNGTCASTPIGGITVSTDSGGGNVTGVIIRRNVIHGNGSGGGGSGVRIFGSTFTVTGTKVYNNTIYNNTGYGVRLGSGSSGTEVKNNHIIGNGSGQIDNQGSGTIQTTNRSTGSITDCTPSTSVFTQKASSSCIDAGTNIGLPYNGSAPDIGAYETIIFATCEVRAAATSTVRVTFTNNAASPLLPATGATTFTVRKNGAGNTVTDSVDRVGDNIYDIPVTNSYAGGDTVDISLSTNNITGSNLVGNTTNQPYVGTLSNQSCTNNAGGAPSHTFTQARFEFHAFDGAEDAPRILPYGRASTGAAENYTSYPVRVGGKIRMRFAVVCGGADCPATAFYLYASTGGAYAQVPDTFGSANVQFCGVTDDINQPANGASTTDQLSTSGTFVAGGLVLTSNAIPTVTLANGNKTELEYCVAFDTNASGTYTFRVYTQEAAALDTYTVTPSIAIVSNASGGSGF